MLSRPISQLLLDPLTNTNYPRQAKEYEEELLLRLDPRLREILEQQEITNQQLEVQHSYNTYENMVSRLCKNKDHIYWKRICDLCKKDFEFDKNGKVIIYKDFCGNPYCNDYDCLKYRIYFAKLVLKSYFYAFPTWRGRDQNWLHLILGKKRIKNITSTTLKDFRKDVIKVLNYMRKEYRNPHMIAVLDMAYDGMTFYLHSHIAMRLRGRMDEKKLNEFAFKNNLKYKRADGKYSRKPKPLINYFAQRLAGKFEHENNKTSWLYSDLFTPEEYFNFFYGKKRFLTRGFNSKQVKEVKKKIKEGIRLLEEAISSNYTNNEKRKTCQFCNHPEFIREFVEDPNKLELKPPGNMPDIEFFYNPGIVKSKIEVIKI